MTRPGERFSEAERARLAGVLHLAHAPAVQEETEGHRCHILDIARHHKAKSLELRAAVSLSRLWQLQGKRAEARELLAPIDGWFSEGFDTTHWPETKTLLEELAR